MKLTNETKVGILAIAAILVLVLGFNFLKGKSLFSKSPVLYAKFANIGSLEKSNEVKINGLDIGTVYDYGPSDKEVDSIIVEIRLNRDVNIPTDSRAFIDAAIVGASYIIIEKGTGNQYLKPGDTISTRLTGSLIGNIQTQLEPTITRVNQTLDSLRIAIGKITDIFDPHTKNNMRDLVANLTLSSAEMAQLLNAQTGQLAQSLAHINSVTDNLAKNNDAINSSIRNIEVTTSKLANANIEGTVAALQGAVNELKTTIGNLNSKNGTLGLLMNDRGLYDRLNKVADRLNSAALSAEITLDDLRVHPKRYVNISVFGGKTKGEPLTSPSAKDTLRVKD